MDLIHTMFSNSPWTTGLIAMYFVVGNVVALALMRFTDDDDDD